ncbi:ABC transporter permease [Acidobacterium sp. S8]|uniref:ABC transporter permease n=1 Tax=Acidobacterium sp. S8 TaxID=1641854 RepID=UPI00131A8C8F|nr:ABC transporter permease [Acidobacterium sp. S8]
MNPVKFFSRRRRDAELAREIEAHIAHEIDENLGRGFSPEEARRQAHLKFGSPRRVREEEWERGTVHFFADIWRDCRYSMRTLWRTPAFSITAIMVMALGIGANTALFTVVRSVLLKPLPFKDPSRLIQIYEKSPNGQRAFSYVAGGMYAAWKKQAPSIEQMAIYGTDPINLSDGGGQLPERIRYASASWEFFSTLGVTPEIGRFFTQSEDSPQAPGTVVLTHGLWERRYGGDKGILGRTIQLDSHPYTVIGVLPAWFVYPDTRTQLWAAIYHEQDPAQIQKVDLHNYFVIGRLRPGATLAQALSEVDTATKRVHLDHPTPFTGSSANVRTMLDGVVHEAKTQLYILLAATSCVLLIACLNVANLLVARSASRRKEISIRASLGGSRWRLLREQLTESAVLALAAGAVGLPLAWLGMQWLVHSRPDLARVDTVQMDTASLLFGVVMIVLSGILAGLIPGSSFMRGPLLASLQESSRTNSAGSSTARMRKVLLAVEVAFTVVLLTSAGLLLKSYQKLRALDLGCATRNVLTMQFALSDVQYNTPEKRLAFFEELLPRLRALPGVKAAGLSTALPGQGYGGDSHFTIMEHPGKQEEQSVMVRAVDPGYFQALQIPVRAGRAFEERERLQNASSIIISESMAKQYFPNENPLGKHIRAGVLNDAEFEVVGIVGNTLWSLTEPEGPTMYLPILCGQWWWSSIGIRSDKDAMSLALPVQKLLAQLNPGLPVSDVLTMEQSIGKSTLDANFTSMLVLAFAVIALLLAAVGLYGVLSYLATQRTGEIGIRIALGAQRGSVLRLLLFDGLMPAWIGLVIGLIGSAFSVQLIRSMLYGTQPLDWTIFASVAAILSLVAAFACSIPAWRAAHLDPVQALRSE